MKKILVVTVLFALYLSCESPTNEDTATRIVDGVSVKMNIDSLISYELSTNIRNDTVFMGYRLGMSENEVTDYSNSLVKIGSIERSGNKLYSTLYFRDTEYRSQIVFEFYSGKLYKLSLGIKDTRISSRIDQTVSITLLYMEKYGSYDIEVKNSYGNSINWISGNRHIQIRSNLNYDALVAYSDLSVIKEIESENESKHENSRNSL